jgi:hypothetical protein
VPVSLRDNLALLFQWQKHDLAVIISHVARSVGPITVHCNICTSRGRLSSCFAHGLTSNVTRKVLHWNKYRRLFNRNEQYTTRVLRYRKRGPPIGRREGEVKIREGEVCSTEPRGSATVAKISDFQGRLGNFRSSSFGCRSSRRTNRGLWWGRSRGVVEGMCIVDSRSRRSSMMNLARRAVDPLAEGSRDLTESFRWCSTKKEG